MMINTKQAACLAWIAVIGSSCNLKGADMSDASPEKLQQSPRFTQPEFGVLTSKNTVNAHTEREEHIKNLKRNLHQWQNTAAARKRNVQQLTAQLTMLMTQLESKNALIKSLEEIKSEKEKLLVENAILREQLKAKDLVIAEKSEKILGKDESIKNLKELNSQVNSNILALESELKAASEARTDLLVENREIKVKLDEAERKYETLQKEFSDSKGQFSRYMNNFNQTLRSMTPGLSGTKTPISIRSITPAQPAQPAEKMVVKTAQDFFNTLGDQ